MIIALQTQYAGPMLGWIWASVVDDGPMSVQHWANDSCLLGGLYLMNNNSPFSAKNVVIGQRKYCSCVF